MMYDADVFGNLMPTCGAIDYNHTLAAINHLYNALDILTYVNNQIVDRLVNGLDLIEKLSNGWLEVNKCRIYTETVPYYEEMLIPTLGLINDAKCMLESIIHWKIGLTIYAKYNILLSIKQAALDGIAPSLDKLESCLVLDEAQEWVLPL